MRRTSCLSLSPWELPASSRLVDMHLAISNDYRVCIKLMGVFTRRRRVASRRMTYLVLLLPGTLLQHSHWQGRRSSRIFQACFKNSPDL